MENLDKQVLQAKKEAMWEATREYNETRKAAILRDRSIPHVHVESHSRDCDGSQSHSYITWEDFVTALSDKLSLFQGEGTITPQSSDGGPGTHAASYHQETEEGYHAGEVWECTSDCDLDWEENRDYSAERMGY